MRIQSTIPDDEDMDNCISLTYNVEIGELHERDKYTWVESLGLTNAKNSINQKNKNNYDYEDDDIIFKKIKVLDFEFKMNHIKQIIKIEVIGNYKQKGD